jgi:hypothetical protein
VAQFAVRECKIVELRSTDSRGRLSPHMIKEKNHYAAYWSSGNVESYESFAGVAQLWAIDVA